MIEYICLAIFGVGTFTASFIYLSVIGTKILYSDKLKEMRKNKDELITIIEARIYNLQLEDKKETDEYKTLNILLNDLCKIK
jgi:hypothetical protein